MIISLTLAQAVDGFILARSADGMSPSTIHAYRWGLNRLVSFLPGCQFASVTTDDLRLFLLQVRESDHLAPASLQVVWRTVKALFGWCAVKFNLPLIEVEPTISTIKPACCRSSCSTFSTHPSCAHLKSVGCFSSNCCTIDIRNLLRFGLGKPNFRERCYFAY